MILWSAFIFGLLGSFHCIGMCGPIAVALPNQHKTKQHFIISRLIYNFGRIITYSFIGMISGWIGKTIMIAGYQSILSITVGIVIILMIVLPSKFAGRIFPFIFLQKLISKFKSNWGKLFKSNSNSSLLLIGILNGFLPCGLVYVAAAAAAVTGTVINGMIYMAMFGLGTIPIMLAVSYFGLFLNVSFKRFLNRMIPIGGIILALLIIIRGLSLGIPYISPKISVSESGEQTIEHCHPVEDSTSNIID